MSAEHDTDKTTKKDEKKSDTRQECTNFVFQNFVILTFLKG